jgi:hypothetical protein
MGVQRIEGAETTKRAKRSDYVEPSPPPSSAPVSGVVVAPPPPELVSVLEEYEMTGRESFPSFNDIKPSSMVSPTPNRGPIDDARTPPTRPDTRWPLVTIVGIGLAALIAVSILVVLLK